MKEEVNPRECSKKGAKNMGNLENCCIFAEDKLHLGIIFKQAWYSALGLHYLCKRLVAPRQRLKGETKNPELWWRQTTDDCLWASNLLRK